MQSYTRLSSVDDDLCLKLLTESYLFLSESYGEIQQAYKEYLIEKGSPYLKSINLNTEQIRCLHSAYKSSSKKFKLGWIDCIREQHIGSCPMCGSSDVGTVEHYLPKTPFPEFSIFSFNLLPSCSICNSKRGSKHDNNVKSQLLHPIFDSEILNKLELKTFFDVSSRVIDFELGFNNRDFNVNEQFRIAEHISMCVDRRAYRRATLNYRAIASENAKGNTEEIYIEFFKKELEVLKRASIGHGWQAAFIRGLIDTDSDTRRQVLNYDI